MRRSMMLFLAGLLAVPALAADKDDKAEPLWRTKLIEAKGLPVPVCARLPVRVRPGVPGIDLDLAPEVHAVAGSPLISLLQDNNDEKATKMIAELTLRVAGDDWKAELAPAVTGLPAGAFGALDPVDAFGEPGECAFELEIEPHISMSFMLDALFVDLRVELYERKGGERTLRYLGAVRSESGFREFEDKKIRDKDKRAELWNALSDEALKARIAADLARDLTLAQNDITGKYATAKPLGYRRQRFVREFVDRMRVVAELDGHYILLGHNKWLYAVDTWRTPP